jgi:hypothetical protein
MVSLVHQAERMLLKRCRELGLRPDHTELLRDLLGWNNRDGSMPESFRGLEPQLSISSDKTADDQRKRQEIADLLTRLLGAEQIEKIRRNPGGVLCDTYGLGWHQAVWIIAQLDIEGLDADVCELRRRVALERMERVVGPTLGYLLENATSV